MLALWLWRPTARPLGGTGECAWVGNRDSPLCTAMTGRWCCVKLSRGELSWWEGLSISVFFTVGDIPGGGGGTGESMKHVTAYSSSLLPLLADGDLHSLFTYEQHINMYPFF